MADAVLRPVPVHRDGADGIDTSGPGIMLPGMKETFHSARPELADPRAFLARAAGDLRASGFVAWHLFRANLRARHRRTLLGYLWLLLPAALATGICAYLQSRRIIAVAPTDLPYPLYVLCGVLMWQVFVDALNAPLQQLWGSRQLIARSHLPHEAVVLGGVFEVGLNAGVRFLVLVAALFVFGFVPGWSVLMVPLGMVALALLGFVLGLAVAPMGMLYDDVRHAVVLIASFWFFLTPVIYPTPESGLVRLNPVTPLLETTRSWIIAPGLGEGFAMVVGCALLGLVGTWLVYRLARPHLVERLG